MKALRSLFAVAAVLIFPCAAHALAASSAPSVFPLCWGASAGTSYIRAIPTASQIGVTNGAASLTDGFPPLTFQPVAAGGIPPFGQDFNGILKQVTCNIQWYDNVGEPATWSSSLSTSIGGYPSGAIVQSATTPGTFWRSTADNNTTNPDASGAGWSAWNFIPVGGNAATATALQTARTIAMTGDVSWSTTFNGTANVTGGGTIQAGAVTGSKIASGTITGGNIAGGTVTSSNLNSPGVSAGTYGNSTSVPVISFDTSGRATGAYNQAIPYAGTGNTGLVQLATNAQALSASNTTNPVTGSGLASGSAAWGSCGTNCQAHAIVFPGGIELVMGNYDCGSASCWNGGNVSVYVPYTSPTVASCLAGVAAPYNPSLVANAPYGIETSGYAGSNYWTFAKTGGQNNIEGFSFTLICHV